MKELKLILIITWMILFPIVHGFGDILDIKYKQMRGVTFKPQTEEDFIIERRNALLLIIVFYFSVILFIHIY